MANHSVTSFELSDFNKTELREIERDARQTAEEMQSGCLMLSHAGQQNTADYLTCAAMALGNVQTADEVRDEMQRREMKVSKWTHRAEILKLEKELRTQTAEMEKSAQVAVTRAEFNSADTIRARGFGLVL
ncbi:MAG: hypothetical protein JSS87_15170 [Acidobacteria bacterium]|nr:hypothetical protein [Acidobacteriota bacterium]